MRVFLEQAEARRRGRLLLAHLREDSGNHAVLRALSDNAVARRLYADSLHSHRRKLLCC